MGRSKKFLVWKRQKRRRKKARLKVKLYEQGQLMRAELPRLAQRLLARKPRTSGTSPHEPPAST